MSTDSQEFTASDTVLLPYARTSLPMGRKIKGRIPVIPTLVRQLRSANLINFQPTFRFIGDSLLFLATARACLDYLALKGRSRPGIIVPASHWLLLRHCDLLADARPCGASGAIAMGASAEATAENGVVTITDDRNPSRVYPGYTYNAETYIYPKYCASVPGAGIKEFPSRPARLYLTLEQQVGVILPADPNDCVPSLVFPNDASLDQATREAFGFSPDDSASRLCALVATTNWPEKKQFGIPNFLRVAEAIRSQFPENNFRFLLVVSPAATELIEPDVDRAIGRAGEHIPIVPIADPRIELLAYLLSRCDVVIGNDTGISHLASVCRRHHAAPRTPTVIIYGRGNYMKWTTGGPNVVPVPSQFSEYLTRNNLSPGDVDDTPWGRESEAAHVSPERVIRAVLAALSARSS